MLLQRVSHPSNMGHSGNNFSLLKSKTFGTSERKRGGLGQRCGKGKEKLSGISAPSSGQDVELDLRPPGRPTNP